MAKSKMTITFDGADSLIGKFNKQPAIIQRKAGEIILNTANRVEKRAKEYAPVDTGYLRQHIISEKTGILSADVTSSAEYSVYQEFGTRKMAGKSFMSPAMKQEEVFLFQKLQNLLKGGLR
ncbi:HK97-gp10 family putative phage morphogenesis protein [Leuconostoc sp. MTCC 10508]|uniref:HK97-gp10 family putative phage morphogenesis protein n=1 Tax=Leuconostoc sp. MTCC 10508 TaxID=2698683 RepID=UPI0020C07638|nr:HK97-gp10 family putative phage morphogenesis protein [Leuconostoc sp. MTCC 10508]